MRLIINADFSDIFIVIQKHISPSPTDIFLGLPDIKFLFSNYSALPTKSLRIQTAIKVLPGMNGFPSKAP